MFQLYKERNFNTLINDTFGFIKQSGKNYFKNYLIFSGGLLLVLIVLMYLVGKVFFQSLFTGFATGESPLVDEYFDSESGFFISAAILSVILILVITLVSFSFPVHYFKLKEKEETPNTNSILSLFKQKTGRMIIFGFLFFITFLPIGIIVNLISGFLFSIVIGIPVSIILSASFTAWICLTYFNYLNSDETYFSAMGTGWNMLFSNYWAHMGSTAIIYLITFVAQIILVIIPYIVVMIIAAVNTTSGETDHTSTLSLMGVMMLVIFILYVVLAYFFGNIIMINQALIYYSCKEDQDKQSVHSEIDLIGSDSE